MRCLGTGSTCSRFSLPQLLPPAAAAAPPSALRGDAILLCSGDSGAPLLGVLGSVSAESCSALRAPAAAAAAASALRPRWCRPAAATAAGDDPGLLLLHAPGAVLGRSGVFSSAPGPPGGSGGGGGGLLPGLPGLPICAGLLLVPMRGLQDAWRAEMGPGGRGGGGGGGRGPLPCCC
jgi:hypothetical protein